MMIFPNAIDATYTPCPISECSGNPLIEALPPIATDEEILSRLKYFPNVTEGERFLPSEIRKHIVARAEMLVVPSPEYIELYRMIEGALLKSYAQKNPFSPTTTHYLHYLNPSDTDIQPLTGRFNPKGTAMTLVGPSGVGKTHMLQSVLNAFPQVIMHREYEGKKLNLNQLVWVTVDCPSDGSLPSFLKNALNAIDEVIGSDLYDDARKKKDTKGDLLVKFERTVRNDFIGVFAIEEMSNLDIPKKNNNINPLLKFLLNLINSSGVPLLFSGNEELLELFTKTFRVARRVENGGLISMEPMGNRMWDAYIKRLWRIQVTNPPTPFDNNLSQHLKNITCAVPDLATRTFMETQKLLIGLADERITEASLNEGKRIALALTSGMLNWYDENHYDEKELLNVKNAMYLAEDNGNITPSKSKKNITLYDPNRPQHPEFEEGLHELMKNTTLSMKGIDPRVVVDSHVEDDVMGFLKSSNVILSKPLTFAL